VGLPFRTWAQDLTFPLKQDSVRFAVIGDSGAGSQKQYELAALMAQFRRKFPFDFVIMLGDNIYGSNKPSDFEKKFERPYKAMLDDGVSFYATLGNHDNPNQRFYKLFNMKEQRYYSFSKGNVRFFVLDSNYMDPKQLDWTE
jgi:predicted MPP superfamily phosphohydrolase